jgi:hypothetical protein
LPVRSLTLTHAATSLFRYTLICCVGMLVAGSACDGDSPDPATPGGWTVTVYYTAVASLHDGPAVRVTGCPQLECERGSDDLGSYPEDFVDAVRAEGTGRTANGQYLNWSHDTGYWLDTAPRDTTGRPLVPWQSAAADPAVLPAGARFHIVHCGTERIDEAVCTRLRQADWTIVDEFTPGLGGPKHLDVYIGEETGPAFTESPWYTTLIGAAIETK